jgi:hypothetical protein
MEEEETMDELQNELIEALKYKIVKQDETIAILQKMVDIQDEMLSNLKKQEALWVQMKS